METVAPLAVAALAGLAVGLEREWSGHATGPAARFAGLRTFFLLGLLGGIAGLLLREGLTGPAAAILAGGAGLAVAAYVVAGRRPGADPDGTTEAAALVVLALTALAPRLGARWSGLLATYPLFAAILTAFGHRMQGAGAALGVLRGLLFGLFSFAAFCFVLAVGLVPLGIGGAFAGAIAVALLVQGIALWRMRAPRALDSREP